jgi:hypothetical protein
LVTFLDSAILHFLKTLQNFLRIPHFLSTSPESDCNHCYENGYDPDIAEEMKVPDNQDREHQKGQHGTLVFTVVALREVELVTVDKPPKHHALDREEDSPFD